MFSLFCLHAVLGHLIFVEFQKYQGVNISDKLCMEENHVVSSGVEFS